MLLILLQLCESNTFGQTADTTFKLKGKLIFIDYDGGDTISPWIGTIATPSYLLLFENTEVSPFFCFRYFVARAYVFRIYQSFIGKEYNLKLSYYKKEPVSQVCHNRKLDFCNDVYILRESDNFYLKVDSIKGMPQ